MRGQSNRVSLIAACFVSGLIAAACAAVAPDRASAPASELAGTRWVAQSIAGEPVAGAAPTLAFNADDRLSGSGGCNTLTAVYETEAGAIAVRALGATERACADDEMMRQELAFLALLAKAARYEREAMRLVLADETGQNIVFAPVA